MSKVQPCPQGVCLLVEDVILHYKAQYGKGPPKEAPTESSANGKWQSIGIKVIQKAFAVEQ